MDCTTGIDTCGMIKGFTFGKFLPFHLGHSALIDFAAEQCDHLTVLVCWSDTEMVPGEDRARWIGSILDNRIDVRLYHYSEADLTNTSVSSDTVSKEWAAVFKELVPEADLLITSEAYGELVARHMGIAHVPFDPARIRVPISANRICADPIANWSFLPVAVQRHYQRKVVLLGTESTGKSTMAERLAAHYGCALVPETGRELVSDSKKFELETLSIVAREHARRIERAAETNSPLLIIDTDMHITMSYARFVFGVDMVLSDEILKTNAADLYIYLSKDVPFRQDGTRFDEDQRNLLDQYHRRLLAEHGIRPVEINGRTWESRLESCLLAIDRMMLDAFRTRTDVEKNRPQADPECGTPVSDPAW